MRVEIDPDQTLGLGELAYMLGRLAGRLAARERIAGMQRDSADRSSTRA